MIAAHELGLADRIQTVRTVVAMTQPNPGLALRKDRPALAAWHKAFEARPSMQATQAADA